MYLLFFEFCKIFSTTLLVIPPAIFIFTVTLLGSAVEKLQKEEQDAIEKDKAKTKDEILKIEEQIREAKNNGHTKNIDLKSLQKHEKETNKKIKRIKNKYSSINLINAGVYPFVSFVFVLAGSQIGIKYNDTFSEINVYLFLIIVILILFGLYKLFNALSLVQEMNSDKKENENFDRLKEVIKIALSEDRENSKFEVKMKFEDKNFPMTINVSTELEIKFLVSLAKGLYAQNVFAWFFIPDGFDLIKPSEKESWRQGPAYDPPNVRTVKLNIGNLNTGQSIRNSIKFKTPILTGTYRINYKLYGNGYSGANNYIELKVV